MGRGNGGTRSKSWRDKSSKNFDGHLFSTPEDVYSYWLQGHAPQMNSWYGGFAVGESAPESVKKLFDKAFSPAGKDMTLYKGVPGDMQEYIEKQIGSSNIVGKSFVDKFYSSTTKTMGTAESYAMKSESEDVVSIIHFNVKKGTPIANPDTNGLSKRIGYNEDEITIRRNVRYTLNRIRVASDDDYTYKHFYIDVSAK